MEAVLDSIGVGDRARHLPGELSGGQQQRVAIARALVKDPAVLLADEPTGNLDEATRDDIIGLLEKLWRERGLTLLLVTHDTAVASRAQRSAVMSKGQLHLRDDRPPGRLMCQHVGVADQVVEMFTDGACAPNPGPGGWGVLLRYGRHVREIHGGEPATTNNRMEMMAAIRGLESLARPSQVRVYTDSVYLRRGITDWLPGWKRNGWQTREKKPVKNADLWRRLDAAAARHEVRWFWVKGHAGHPENERADALACQGAAEAAIGRLG